MYFYQNRLKIGIEVRKADQKRKNTTKPMFE